MAAASTAMGGERYNILATEERWQLSVVPGRIPYAYDALLRFAIMARLPAATPLVAPVTNAPDWAPLLDSYGHDALRLCLLSDTPLSQPLPWNDGALDGAWRFIHRLWNVVQAALPTLPAVSGGGPAHPFHRFIDNAVMAVTHDFKAARLHTAIARLRALTHEIDHFLISSPDGLQSKRLGVECLLQMLHPVVPHITSELWVQLGHTAPIAQTPWPVMVVKGNVPATTALAPLKAIAATPPIGPEYTNETDPFSPFQPCEPASHALDVVA
jgi:hypothetical protein